MSLLTQFAQSYEYESSIDGMSGPDSAAAAAIFFTMMLFTFFIFIIIYVVVALLLGRIFKKAGVDQWIAWVPFYNTWKTLQLGGQQGFWAILAVIPIVNIVAAIFLYIAMYNIGLKLQKEGWFVLLAIFVPIVWYAWLALDSSKWSEVAEGATPAKDPVTA